jgi:hypothetical protein
MVKSYSTKFLKNYSLYIKVIYVIMVHIFLTQTLLQTSVCIFKEFQHKRLIGHLLDIQTVFLHCRIFIHSYEF